MRQKLTEVEKVLKLLQKIESNFLQAESIDGSIIVEVLNAVADVNVEFYGCRELPDIPFYEYADNIILFRKQLKKWMDKLYDELRYRKTLSNKIDYDFYVFASHIAVMSEEDLVKESVSCLEEIRKDCEQNYELIKNIHNCYHYFWGLLDLDNGNIDLVRNRVHEIKSHWEDFEWLYQNLADYRSKKVLYGILHYWLTFDYASKNAIIENNYDDYYDYDIVSCSEQEVFVDLGAYNGDSVLSFMDNFGIYKRIYCYEMTSSSMEEMKKNLDCFDNIIYRQAAVGNENGIKCMAEVNGASSNIVIQQGEDDVILKQQRSIQIPIVKLDDDVKEPITFLKMDIEGSELEAMKGAEQHIKQDKPKLAVCSYHNNRHIYEIPRLMRAYNPQYKLYMRYNGPQNNVLTSEYVTFAIP